MPKASPIQSSFNGGEISPLCYGLVELPRYKDSLAICQNYIPTIQGPITRRPGTAFVAPVKTQSLFTRLVSFEASTTDALVLEFGNHYIRAFQNNAVYSLVPDLTITGITKANPAVVTTSSSLPSNGDTVLITGVSGMTEINNREFVVANASGSTFELTGLNSSSFTTYTSGGTATVVYEVTTCNDVITGTDTVPYATADLPQLQFEQSNDVLYVAHPDHPPFKISFESNGTLFMEKIALQNGPYLPQGKASDGTSATLTTGTVSGGVLPVTASNTHGINGGAGFTSYDVGRLIRLKDGGTWYWARISSVGSTTTFNIRSIIFPTTLPPDSKACTIWQLGVWSDGLGWPPAITFHEDRLVLAGPGASLYGSNTSDYENFSPSDSSGTIAANNAYSFTLNSKDLNDIVWATSDEQGMLMGTTGGEWLVSSASTGSALSATSVSARKATSFGSEPVQPVQSGKSSLFVQRGGRKLRELNYYFDVSGFRAEDLTVLSEHITKSQITFLAVQKIPQPTVWATRSDGVLIAMVYERDLDAVKVGWSRHVLGGTGVEVESVAVVSSADGESQDVWLIVKRTINGATTRYVEYITEFFDFSGETALEDAFFVDSGLTYDSTATTTVSGLNHLEGETVAILADGEPLENQTVISGRILLDEAASKVQVGLPYSSRGQKLRTEAGAADGTSFGKTRRTHRLGIMLLNTLGFKLGPGFNTLDDITLNDPSDANYDQALGLYSGITSESLSSDYDFDNMLCWEQTQPVPGTILGLYPQIVTQDRG